MKRHPASERRVGAERGEALVLVTRVATEFGHGVAPDALRALCVQVRLQRLFGGLLREEAGEVPACARGREAGIVEVALGLGKPASGLVHAGFRSYTTRPSRSAWRTKLESSRAAASSSGVKTSRSIATEARARR